MAGLIDLNGLGHFKAKENAMVADTYSASKTYAVGDYVYYNGTLYRCTTAISTTEAWTSGHWTAVKLADDCSSLKTAITNIYDGKEHINYTINNGYISSNGSISPPTSGANEVYTNQIPVSEGDTFYISLQIDGTGNQMWLVYATYDSTGTFQKREYLVAAVQNTYSGELVIPNGVSFIAFSYRTFTGATFTVLKQLENSKDIQTLENELGQASDNIDKLAKDMYGKDPDIEATGIVLANYISSNGTVTPAGSMQYGFYDVSSGGTVVVDTSAFSDTVIINICDSSKAFIRNIINWGSPNKYSINLENGEDYVCVSCKSVDADLIHVYIGDVISSIEYKVTAKGISFTDATHNLLYAKHAKGNTGTRLTLFHFSDIHADTAALNRIMGEAEKLTYNDAICTGDFTADTAAQISSWWNPSIMTCIGNHDTATYSDGAYNWTALSMADRDAYYIAPFESNWGITHTSGTSYYYKDYATQKVRLIVMDVMLYEAEDQTEATAQTSWLANLLSDAITNNMHVLIAIHAPHGGATPENCSFSRYGETTMPTLGDCNTPQTVIDAVDTAITNGLHFIGYICGHTHQDNVWDAENNGKQLMYCVTCATVSNANQWKNSDQHRDTQNDAYNIITIDTTNTLVKIIRGGGADIDDHMRTRKAICFNYTTGEKVGEVL